MTAIQAVVESIALLDLVHCYAGFIIDNTVKISSPSSQYFNSNNCNNHSAQKHSANGSPSERSSQFGDKNGDGEMRGYVRPRMLRRGSLLIKHGRHPLMELLRRKQDANHNGSKHSGSDTNSAFHDVNTNSFQPNDIYLTESQSFQLLIGPNSSGKSTFLLQVASIVILAHAGCFVPAELAHIPLLERLVQIH